MNILKVGKLYRASKNFLLHKTPDTRLSDCLGIGLTYTESYLVLEVKTIVTHDPIILAIKVLTPNGIYGWFFLMENEFSLFQEIDQEHE